MNAAEIFAQMPDAFQPEKAGNLRATIQFNLSGEGGGDWAVAIADSTCTIIEGQAEKPELTIGMAANDFVEETKGVEGIEKIILFGSVARGEEKLTSDTDIAIIGKKDKNLENKITDIAGRVLEKTRIKVVPVLLTKKEVTGKLAEELKAGEVLYEK